jgi:ferredoxin-NADP reductase
MAFIPFKVTKENYKISKIVDETHDMKSFYLKPKDNNEIFEYKPGHFINCTIHGKEDLGKRSYSISSSPTEKDSLRISVKLMGTFTHALWNMKIDDTIEIMGPLGLPYIREESDENDIVLISGGSGIAPFRSLIKYAIDIKMKNKMFLLLSNKTMSDVCFREELMDFCREKDNFILTHFITNEDITSNEFFHKSRINEDYFRRILLEPEKKLYLLCGPKGFITAAVEILTKMKVPMSRIKTEAWGN